ncbi:hypothetical protein [Kribbella sp. NPDC048928]|uniref:hypothetical protein n=1 Tax=Kribbella sp. NPDC048928 TaxID=3364111 RepID=UPI0037206766
MHRAVIVWGAVLLALTGCSSHDTTRAASAAPPTSASTLRPTATLCDRVQQGLDGRWRTGEAEFASGVPLADGCSLVSVAQPDDRVRVTVSAIAVTDAQFDAYRKNDDEYLREVRYAAKLIDGGVGAGSWAVNPAAAAPWLVFRSGGRVIRLRMLNDGAGTLAELRSIAQAVVALPHGLPASRAQVVRPECARGTAAAERLLGGTALLRRDSIDDGHLACQWGSATRSVVVRSGDKGSDAALDFGYLKDGGSSGLARPVRLGAEGWQQTDGQLTFRTAKGTYVEVWTSPLDESLAGPILALARTLVPAYS